jgi:hypothetical protein
MKSRRPHLSIPFALAPTLSVAQISVFPEFESAQPFPRGRWNELETFRPNVLVGYAYDFSRLAQEVESSRVKLTTLDRALFILTDCGTPPINEKLRHHLWRVFGVPVYELIIAPGCTLLAAECESHSGWHLQPGIAAYLSEGKIVYDLRRLKHTHTGYAGDLDLSPCECGRNTPRLRNLAPYTRSVEQASALLRAS